jgi:hypothetical protein
MTITQADIDRGLLTETWLPAKIGTHNFVSEASTLQIAVQDFPPRKLETTLGNQNPFVVIEKHPNFALYKQEFGCLYLKVFND